MQSKASCKSLGTEVFCRLRSRQKHYSGRRTCKIQWKAFFQAKHAHETGQIWDKSLASNGRRHLLRSTVSGLLGQGQNEQRASKRKGLGFYVVWTLGEPYLDDYRHFFFGNFFCSADLVQSLQSRNMHLRVWNSSDDKFSAKTISINNFSWERVDSKSLYGG